MSGGGGFGDAEWLENGVACGWRLGSGEAISGFTLELQPD